MTTVSDDIFADAPPARVLPEPADTDETPPPAAAPVTSPITRASLREAAERAAALRRILGRAAEFLDRPASLVHAQPPTFARARELHHEAAARSPVRPLQHARLAWGYFHLLTVKPALNLAEWVTETPLRFFAALALALIIYFGS